MTPPEGRQALDLAAPAATQLGRCHSSPAAATAAQPEITVTEFLATESPSLRLGSVPPQSAAQTPPASHRDRMTLASDSGIQTLTMCVSRYHDFKLLRVPGP